MNPRWKIRIQDMLVGTACTVLFHLMKRIVSYVLLKLSLRFLYAFKELSEDFFLVILITRNYQKTFFLVILIIFQKTLFHPRFRPVVFLSAYICAIHIASLEDDQFSFFLLFSKHDYPFTWQHIISTPFFFSISRGPPSVLFGEWLLPAQSASSNQNVMIFILSLILIFLKLEIFGCETHPFIL